MNKYHSGMAKPHGSPPPTGKRARQPALPEEKPQARFGAKAHGKKTERDAGFPLIKTHVAGNF